MSKYNKIPIEDDEQKEFVKWLDGKGLKYTSIPNSTWTPSFTQKNKNKALGLKPGLPDILVIVNNRIVWVEMKRAKKSLSKVSDVQQEWIDALNKCDNCQAEVCYGAEEAKKFIKRILIIN